MSPLSGVGRGLLVSTTEPQSSLGKGHTSDL